MKRLLGLLAVWVLCGSAASAATVTFSVTTDQTTYDVNDIVYWIIRVTADKPVTGAGCNLTDAGGHTLTIANQYDYLAPVGLWQLGPNPYDFGYANGLTVLGRGTPSGSTLLDIHELDMSSPFPGGDGDGTARRFADGSFTASIVGTHRLTAAAFSGSYSIDGTNAAEFETKQSGYVDYTVTPEPATLGLVGFWLVGLLADAKRRRRTA